MNNEIMQFVQFLIDTENQSIQRTNQHLRKNEKLFESDQESRAKLILTNFKKQLNILFDYLKSYPNELTLSDINYLFLNLDAFFLKKELNIHQYEKYRYRAEYYNDNDEYCSYWTETPYPIGKTAEILELNSVKSSALVQMCELNCEQISIQLPPTPPELPFVDAKLKTMIPANEETIIPTLIQPTLFDVFTKLMLCEHSSSLKKYKGLAQLKNDRHFVESLNNNIEEWLKKANSPKDLRNTIAYKIASTPRNSPVVTFFSGTHFNGTHTQRKLDKMIKQEIERRKSTANHPTDECFLLTKFK